MKKTQPLKRNLMIELIIAVLCIFLPFVYMKIGPGGYAYYGPTVPDIYILGGYILGKDTSWWAISFAYKFQLCFIILYIVLTYVSIKRSSNSKQVIFLHIIKTGLILCFPPWLFFYEEHVQNNSDGADLTVYPHIGWIAYLGLVYIHIRIYFQLRQLKQTHGI
jgi:hypothetical protein